MKLILITLAIVGMTQIHVSTPSCFDQGQPVDCSLVR
jgi:hypothetical protein